MRERQNRDMVIGFTLKIQWLHCRCRDGPRGETGLKEKRVDGIPPFLAAGKNGMRFGRRFAGRTRVD
jgi:hypothetical protein